MSRDQALDAQILTTALKLLASPADPVHLALIFEKVSNLLRYSIIKTSLH